MSSTKPNNNFNYNLVVLSKKDDLWTKAYFVEKNNDYEIISSVISGDGNTVIQLYKYTDEYYGLFIYRNNNTEEIEHEDIKLNDIISSKLNIDIESLKISHNGIYIGMLFKSNTQVYFGIINIINYSMFLSDVLNLNKDHNYRFIINDDIVITNFDIRLNNTTLNNNIYINDTTSLFDKRENWNIKEVNIEENHILKILDMKLNSMNILSLYTLRKEIDNNYNIIIININLENIHIEQYLLNNCDRVNIDTINVKSSNDNNVYLIKLNTIYDSEYSLLEINRINKIYINNSNMKNEFNNLTSLITKDMFYSSSNCISGNGTTSLIQTLNLNGTNKLFQLFESNVNHENNKITTKELDLSDYLDLIPKYNVTRMDLSYDGNKLILF